MDDDRWRTEIRSIRFARNGRTRRARRLTRRRSRYDVGGDARCDRSRGLVRGFGREHGTYDERGDRIGGDADARDPADPAGANARTRARGRDGVVCVACLESDVECFVCVVFGTVRLLRLTEAPRCSFIRSQIVCFNTAAVMGAMRFGFMPSVKKNYGGASSYKMVDQEGTKNIGSKDPAGFTAVDVLAAGSFATILSAGEILSGQVPY